MYSITRPKRFECAGGSYVELVGMTSIRYREARRDMHIDAEVLRGSRGLRVYSDSIRYWEASGTREAVDDAGRVRIVEHIRDAFLRKGYRIIIESRRCASGCHESPASSVVIRDSSGRDCDAELPNLRRCESSS